MDVGVPPSPNRSQLYLTSVASGTVAYACNESVLIVKVNVFARVGQAYRRFSDSTELWVSGLRLKAVVALE